MEPVSIIGIIPQKLKITGVQKNQLMAGIGIGVSKGMARVPTKTVAISEQCRVFKVKSKNSKVKKSFMGYVLLEMGL